MSDALKRVDERADERLEARKAEINAMYRHAERRLLLIFAFLMVMAALFQWLVAQLPDLSSEALEVVCRVLYT